jgi:hypothetical protein
MTARARRQTSKKENAWREPEPHLGLRASGVRAERDARAPHALELQRGHWALPLGGRARLRLLGGLLLLGLGLLLLLVGLGLGLLHLLLEHLLPLLLRGDQPAHAHAAAARGARGPRAAGARGPRAAGAA